MMESLDEPDEINFAAEFAVGDFVEVLPRYMAAMKGLVDRQRALANLSPDPDDPLAYRIFRIKEVEPVAMDGEALWVYSLEGIDKLTFVGDMFRKMSMQ